MFAIDEDKVSEIIRYLYLDIPLFDRRETKVLGDDKCMANGHPTAAILRNWCINNLKILSGLI